jgi:hypothetical protein
MSKKDDPLTERVSRLEERVNALYDRLERIERTVDRIDNRVWYIVTGVGITIALQILLLLMRGL